MKQSKTTLSADNRWHITLQRTLKGKHVYPPKDSGQEWDEELYYNCFRTKQGAIVQLEAEIIYLHLGDPEVSMTLQITGENAITDEEIPEAIAEARRYIPEYLIKLKAEHLIDSANGSGYAAKEDVDRMPLDQMRKLRDEFAARPTTVFCSSAMAIIDKEIEWRVLYEFAKALPDGRRKMLGLKLRDITTPATRKAAVVQFKAVISAVTPPLISR